MSKAKRVLLVLKWLNSSYGSRFLSFRMKSQVYNVLIYSTSTALGAEPSQNAFPITSTSNSVSHTSRTLRPTLPALVPVVSEKYLCLHQLTSFLGFRSYDILVSQVLCTCSHGKRIMNYLFTSEKCNQKTCMPLQ